MEYFELYHFLKKLVNYSDSSIPIDSNSKIYNMEFKSDNSDILLGQEYYTCKQHQGIEFTDTLEVARNIVINEILDVRDSKVIENHQFKYHIFKPIEEGKSKRVILLFHGFNEKYWDKYLPWAKVMMDQTGSTIILFPISFHMNRAPQAWSDKRLMFNSCEHRKKSFPDIRDSSLSNVAISSRIQYNPQRFFWSGIQTYYDVLQLINQIKQDKHALIAPDTTIDIFAYSIGSLLGEILMMTNPLEIFNNSKLCLFCGGPVFNRMSPVSKFILDSEANVALYSYVVEHLESHLKNDPRLGHYFGNDHKEGRILLSMLNYKSMKKLREELLLTISKRVMAITLEDDEVVPPYEVINTLKGSERNIPIRIETINLPYNYKHEDPFPLNVKIKDDVNRGFETIFNLVVDFLK